MRKDRAQPFHSGPPSVPIAMPIPSGARFEKDDHRGNRQLVVDTGEHRPERARHGDSASRQREETSFAAVRRWLRSAAVSLFAAHSLIKSFTGQSSKLPSGRYLRSLRWLQRACVPACLRLGALTCASVPSNNHRNFPLEQFFGRDCKRVGLVLYVDHHWRVHAAATHPAQPGAAEGSCSAQVRAFGGALT